MSSTMPPVPHGAAITDQAGIIPGVWSDFFKQLLKRIGGPVAKTNAELDASITALNPKLVPTGSILEYGGTSAPSGFLLCDGSPISRTTYSALFAAIGTAFGSGDGSTTFNLPDLRGKFLVGKDASTFATLGGSGGSATAALPDHAHSVSLTTGAPSGTVAGTGAGSAVATSNHTHSVSGATGGITSAPTVSVLPPYVVLNMIIKT